MGCILSFQYSIELVSECYHLKANVLYRYQQMLHRNLVYLATLADSNQNLSNQLLPVSCMFFTFTNVHDLVSQHVNFNYPW